MLKNLRLNPSDVFSNEYQDHGLKETVVKGSFSLGVSQGIGFVLSMVNTMVLARLLTPDDFGLIGMVTVFINFLIMFKDAGLSMATVQREKITRQQISTLFWINVLISLVLGIALMLSSPLVAGFYKREELSAVTAVLAVSYILQGLTIQHSALLQRHLKFTIMALSEVIAQLSGVIVGITMAYLGFSYWALVGGVLARTIVLLVLTFYSCPWIPGKMTKGTGIRDMVKFGGNVTISHIVGYFSRNLDSILIGRFIGAEPLGLYSRAYALLMQPLVQIRAPLTRPVLPVLSSLRNDEIKYQNYFRKFFEIGIVLALPITVYCYLESEFLIRILLGQEWMGAEPVFKILAIGGVFVISSGFPATVMLSFGFTQRFLYLNIARAIITSISFVIGMQFGIIGMAIAYTVSSFINMVLMTYYSTRETPIYLQLVFKCISGPFIAVLIAGTVAYSIARIYSDNSIIKHLLIGFSFFLVYTGINISRRDMREMIRSILDSILKAK